MLEIILSSAIVSTVISGTLIFLVKQSIEEKYKQRHELFTRELDKKEKVEIISDLLAEWIKYSHGENLSKEYRTNLNRLSFKCTLWLPLELSKELSKALQLEQDAKSIFEILLMARKELMDDELLTVKNVTYWSIDKETQSNNENNT